jgi:hypothetical protein
MANRRVGAPNVNDCCVVPVGGHAGAPTSPLPDTPDKVYCTVGHAGTPLASPFSQWSNHENIGCDGQSSGSSAS